LPIFGFREALLLKQTVPSGLGKEDIGRRHLCSFSCKSTGWKGFCYDHTSRLPSLYICWHNSQV